MVRIPKADYDKMLKRNAGIQRGIEKRKADSMMKQATKYAKEGEILLNLGTNIISSKNNFDIERTGWASSVPSANYIIANNPKYAKWSAVEKDIDANEAGEGGDGIDEVLIRDSNDKIRYINGYKIKPSKFESRKDYHANFPRIEDRQATKFNDYLRDTEIDVNWVVGWKHPEAVRIGADGKLRPAEKAQPKLKNHFARYVAKKFIELFKLDQYNLYSTIPKNKRSKVAIIFTNLAWRSKVGDLLKAQGMNLTHLPLDEYIKTINKHVKDNNKLQKALADYIKTMIEYQPKRDENDALIQDDFTNYYIQNFTDAVNAA